LIEGEYNLKYRLQFTVKAERSLKALDPKFILPFLLLAPIMIASCIPEATSEPNQPPIPSSTLSETAQPILSAEPSATLCPAATAEPFWVDPVTSPTDQLSQTITVYIGRGEEVTVITESGTFSVTGDFDYLDHPARVEISLLPDTVHHLEVRAKVRTGSGSSPVENCMYGGYTLTTTTDELGIPLIITQGTSTP
jgi:hypothetical protein